MHYKDLQNIFITQIRIINQKKIDLTNIQISQENN